MESFFIIVLQSKSCFSEQCHKKVCQCHHNNNNDSSPHCLTVFYSLTFQVHKEELQHLEAKHASLGTEDTDPDVTIESEEIIVTEEVESTVEDKENIQDGTDPAQSTKADDAKAENQAAGQGQNKGGKSPNKALQRYHNLNDVLTEGSPVAKRLFTSGGDEAEAEIYEEARKLLVRTGKVI